MKYKDMLINGDYTEDEIITAYLEEHNDAFSDAVANCGELEGFYLNAIRKENNLWGLRAVKIISQYLMREIQADINALKGDDDDYEQEELNRFNQQEVKSINKEHKNER